MIINSSMDDAIITLRTYIDNHPEDDSDYNKIRLSMIAYIVALNNNNQTYTALIDYPITNSEIDESIKEHGATKITVNFKREPVPAMINIDINIIKD